MTESGGARGVGGGSARGSLRSGGDHPSGSDGDRIASGGLSLASAATVEFEPTSLGGGLDGIDEVPEGNASLLSCVMNQV